jgi:uncharacterized protein
MKLARHFKPSAIYMGRFERGEDIITELEAFCEENGIKAGWVNIIGAVDKATLSYWDQQQHQYVHKPLAGEYEIVNCSGNISLKDGKPFAHIHAVLSGTDYSCLGGHLWPKSVSVFAGEFVLFSMEKALPEEPDLCRTLDAQTGLTLWNE